MIDLPRHLTLTLDHNDHKNVYETFEQALENGRYREEDFVTPVQFKIARAQDSVWTLHWYPDTPIGFYSKHAADLDYLLAWVEEHKEDFK